MALGADRETLRSRFLGGSSVGFSLPEVSHALPPGTVLVAQVDSLEGLLVNVKNKTFQDVVNYAPGLNMQFQALAQALDGTDAPVTRGVRARLADLEAEWAALKQRVDGVVGGELERFNALVREKGIQAVTPQQR